MQRFRDKNDLMLWLENNVPRKAIEYAMVDGKIELLGAFKCVVDSGNPCWIIKVTSKRGLSWNIVITPSIFTHKYYVYTVKKVPWKYWWGDSFNKELFCGDRPEVYKKLRAKHSEG